MSDLVSHDSYGLGCVIQVEAAAVTVDLRSQRRLLAALETFTEALAHQGSPVPYRLHGELAMYRAMFDIRRTR